MVSLGHYKLTKLSIVSMVSYGVGMVGTIKKINHVMNYSTSNLSVIVSYNVKFLTKLLNAMPTPCNNRTFNQIWIMVEKSHQQNVFLGHHCHNQATLAGRNAHSTTILQVYGYLAVQIMFKAHMRRH